MTCDWDLCNNRSIDFLREKQVTCYYSENSSELITAQQCIGQACLQIINQSDGSLFRRGCFFQDWRFAEGRIETGIYTLPNWITISICAEDYCNKDIETVNKSLLDCIPKYPPFTPYEYSLLNRNLSWNEKLIVNKLPKDYTMTCAMEKRAYSLIFSFFSLKLFNYKY
ncbi:unnamed protein product, partial [Mesorhabditis belari]|uniref:DUF7622 domain-containing protein n=1 Tax=Mesorhabditis belari TaxID=2138241 RepID=A0AAF3F6X3_9BILA